MITLRPYQQQFVDEIRQKLFEKQKVIACMATGGGKTKCFLAISKMAIERKKTVLIISESSKIFKQISDEIGNCTNIVSSVKHLDIVPNTAFVAMGQTLVKRPFMVTQFANLGSNLLVIYDECHVATCFKLLLQLKDAYHIGFSATPVGNHLSLLYNDIIIGKQAQELVELGFLSPYHHFERRVTNLSNLKKGSNGDYTEASQEDVFKKAEVYNGVFEDIKKFPYKKCMVFTSSIAHCEDTAHKFRSQGYKVAVVHSQNKESSFELFQFMDILSDTNICISVGVLTKGFDAPFVDLIILLRATTSLALFNQMTGRGSRISPFTNKTHWTVLCYGGNATRHMPWNYSHPWEDMWNKKPKKKTDGVPPVKICPICEAMVHVSATKCDACGHIFIKPPPTAKETELVEINVAYNALRGRNISTLTPLELRDYVRSTNKKAYGIRIAKAKGFDFLCKYSKAMGYKAGFAYSNQTHEVIHFADIVIR